MLLSKFICRFPNCGRTFDSKKGLIYHERSDARHHLNKTLYKYNEVRGNKRLLIPCESSNDFERRNAQKRIATGPSFSEQVVVLSEEQKMYRDYFQDYIFILLTIEIMSQRCIMSTN